MAKILVSIVMGSKSEWGLAVQKHRDERVQNVLDNANLKG